MLALPLWSNICGIEGGAFSHAIPYTQPNISSDFFISIAKQIVCETEFGLKAVLPCWVSYVLQK